jgi:hypothetical protein
VSKPWFAFARRSKEEAVLKVSTAFFIRKNCVSYEGSARVACWQNIAGSDPENLWLSAIQIGIDARCNHVATITIIPAVWNQLLKRSESSSLTTNL